MDFHGWPVVKNKGQANGEVYSIGNSAELEADDFSSDRLKWQWAFWGLESAKDYRLSNGRLELTGSKAQLRALLAISSVPDYEATFKVETEGAIEAGLVLFYNDEEYVGIGLRNDTIYGLSRGKKAWSEIPFGGCRYFRLRVERAILSLFYSKDGVKWQTYPHGFDVSGYHTHTFSGFLSLKPAVLCKGEGKVWIDDFQIKRLVAENIE